MQSCQYGFQGGRNFDGKCPGHLSLATLSTLYRMQVAESQIYRRIGKRCIDCLKEFASHQKTVTDRDAMFLKLFVILLKAEEPRVVFLQYQTSVVMITDACYEKDSRDRICGLGGIVVDNSLGVNIFFSCELSEKQRNILAEPCKKQIMFETETLCAILAYSLWTSLLLNRMCFLYADNEATKYSNDERVLRKSYC